MSGIASTIRYVDGRQQRCGEGGTERLRIRKFVSDMMPADKVEVIRELQKEGHVVARVGDGINDSPALAYADIGIAMKNGGGRRTRIRRRGSDGGQSLETGAGNRDFKELDEAHPAKLRMIAGLNTLALLLSFPAGLVSPKITAVVSNRSAILAAVNAIRPILRS